MTARSRGFTLLELLVVLVILALGAAVATPAVVKMVDSLNQKARREAVAIYLESLPLAAMRAGREHRLAATNGYVWVEKALGRDAARQLGEELDGARVWVERPIVYRANGACTGGTLHWQLPSDERFSFELEAPLCRP